MKAIEAFDLNIARCRNLITTYGDLRSSGTSHANASDVLRSAVVLTVAALDAYVHSKVSENLVPYIRRELRRDKKKLEVIAKILQEKKVTPVDFMEAAARPRPFVQIRKHLDDFIYKQTFQHPGGIEAATELIGHPKPWGAVAKIIGSPETDVRRNLAQYIQRRNQIAHEGDRHRSKKKAGVRRRIDRSYVDAAVEFISDLVRALDEVLIVA